MRDAYTREVLVRAGHLERLSLAAAELRTEARRGWRCAIAAAVAAAVAMAPSISAAAMLL